MSQAAAIIEAALAGGWKLDKELLKKALKSNGLYKICLDYNGAGPLDGNCVPIAYALQRVLQGGKVSSLVGARVHHGSGRRVQAQHVLLKKGSSFWDADGEQSAERLIARWQAEEGVLVSTIRDFAEQDCPDSPRDPKLVQQLTDYLWKKSLKKSQRR